MSTEIFCDRDYGWRCEGIEGGNRKRAAKKGDDKADREGGRREEGEREAAREEESEKEPLKRRRQGR